MGWGHGGSIRIVDFNGSVARSQVFEREIAFEEMIGASCVANHFMGFGGTMERFN